MGLENKTALIGIAIGFCIALVGVAMPLAFDVDPFFWRAVFCVGVLMTALLSVWLLWEHLARNHPDSKVKHRRTMWFAFGGLAALGGAIWAAIAIPQPKNYSAMILAMRGAYVMRPMLRLPPFV